MFPFLRLFKVLLFSMSHIRENASNHQIKVSVCFLRTIDASVALNKQSNNNFIFSAVRTPIQVSRYTHLKLINFMYFASVPLFLFTLLHCHLLIRCMFTTSVLCWLYLCRINSYFVEMAIEIKSSQVKLQQPFINRFISLLFIHIDNVQYWLDLVAFVYWTIWGLNAWNEVYTA